MPENLKTCDMCLGKREPPPVPVSAAAAASFVTYGEPRPLDGVDYILHPGVKKSGAGAGSLIGGLFKRVFVKGNGETTKSDPVDPLGNK